MKKFVWIAALALGLGIAADASAIDAIRKLGNARVSGTIKGCLLYTSTRITARSSPA